MNQIKEFVMDVFTFTGDKRLGGLRDRDFRIAAVLWLFLGLFGAHRFYTRQYGTAILQLLTLGGLGVWWMIDFFLLDALVLRLKARRKIPVVRIVHY